MHAHAANSRSVGGIQNSTATTRVWVGPYAGCRLLNPAECLLLFGLLLLSSFFLLSPCMQMIRPLSHFMCLYYHSD